MCGVRELVVDSWMRSNGVVRDDDEEREMNVGEGAARWLLGAGCWAVVRRAGVRAEDECQSQGLGD